MPDTGKALQHAALRQQQAMGQYGVSRPAILTALKQSGIICRPPAASADDGRFPWTCFFMPEKRSEISYLYVILSFPLPRLRADKAQKYASIGHMRRESA